jgi:polar amino acid transport system substrate-binding protein
MTRQKPCSVHKSAALVCTLAALALLFDGGTARTDETLARIKKEAVLRVANSGVYPPFESVQNGKLVGLDIDLTNLLAKDLGVDAEIQVIDFKGLIAALKSGKVDALVTAMTYTPERAEQIAFSEPYYRTAMVVATRADGPLISSLADLTGKQLGAEIGTTGDRAIREVKGAASTKSYDSLMLALKDMENKRIDAVVSTLPPTQYLIHTNFHDVKVAYRYNEGYVAVNTRKEDITLLAAIDQALEKISQEGQLRELQIKWFGEASQ